MYRQFQARRVLDVLAVVLAYRKTPTRAVAVPRTPRRPTLVSLSSPPTMAPGTPSEAIMSMLRYVVYVDDSSCAWRIDGRNALYSGYPRPMNAQTVMSRLVEMAILGVWNSCRTCDPRRLWSLRLIAALASVRATYPAGSHAFRSSMVSDVVLPFRRATSWTTATACSSFPLPIRYFGDS